MCSVVEYILHTYEVLGSNPSAKKSDFQKVIYCAFPPYAHPKIANPSKTKKLSGGFHVKIL